MKKAPLPGPRLTTELWAPGSRVSGAGLCPRHGATDTGPYWAAQGTQFWRTGSPVLSGYGDKACLQSGRPRAEGGLAGLAPADVAWTQTMLFFSHIGGSKENAVQEKGENPIFFPGNEPALFLH